VLKQDCVSDIPLCSFAQSAANVRDCGNEAGMNNISNISNDNINNNNRKNTPVAVQKRVTQKVTILYQRLSVEDDRDTESQSIENQRIMLQDYAERHGFIPYLHIADDGYSGTNWQRPGWNEVITKVEAGEVSVLMVKDSSRIGRDFLRVGLCRELFKEKNVRLICVNDGIDTSRGDDEVIPYR
jgi:predicted site-specific integrase-resolvase